MTLLVLNCAQPQPEPMMSMLLRRDIRPFDVRALARSLARRSLLPRWRWRRARPRRGRKGST